MKKLWSFIESNNLFDDFDRIYEYILKINKHLDKNLVYDSLIRGFIRDGSAMEEISHIILERMVFETMELSTKKLFELVNHGKFVSFSHKDCWDLAKSNRDSYNQLIKGGTFNFPILVYFSGGKYWIMDGNHRFFFLKCCFDNSYTKIASIHKLILMKNSKKSNDIMSY